MLTFDDLRRREFSRLDRSSHAYLDYTGSALYAGGRLVGLSRQVWITV